MVNLFDAINESPDLTDKTKRSYMTHLKSIQKRVNDVPLEDVILQHKKYIGLFLKWFENKTSLKTMVTFILTVFRHNPSFKEEHNKVYDAWRKVFDDAITLHDETNGE